MPVGDATVPFSTDTVWTAPGTWDFGGSFAFNDTDSQIAFAVGTGPDVETGAIYVLDFASGEFVPRDESNSTLLYVESWTNDNLITK